MITRGRTIGFVLGGAAAVALGAIRHARGAMGRTVPGGILIRNAPVYDTLSHRLLLAPLFTRIAADVGALVPAGTRVLEVGCGPGRLSILLSRDYGLDVTGVDLDPAMIERAQANANRSNDGGHRPSFLVGDVASLAFPDGSFDVVVSTLSMHHWADPVAGLGEIGRVLRPSGRALMWDFRAGRVPLHGRLTDPADRATGPTLRVASATPWRWPWRLTLTRRVEFVPAAVLGS